MATELGLWSGLRMETRLAQRPEQHLAQTLDCILELRQGLSDPLEAASELYDASPKVSVPIRIGPYTITVNAAIVDQESLARLFEREEFAGIISREEQTYQFFNRHLRSPPEIAPILPQLMAFHCLAAVRVKSFGDETGTLAQYQAIALEMAYTKTLLGEAEYRVYEEWRQTIERTDFFKRDDWRGIVAKTSARFTDIIEEMHRNSHAARFLVVARGERFRVHGDELVSASGERVPVYRKRRRGK